MAFYPAIFTFIQPVIGKMAAAPFLVSQLLQMVLANLSFVSYNVDGGLLIVSVRQPADMGMCDY